MSALALGCLLIAVFFFRLVELYNFLQLANANRGNCMPHPFLLTLNLKTQGKIKGSSTQKGHSAVNGVICHGFEFGVQSPVDSGTGSATGKRQHNPITIRKEVDLASPLFLQALCTNEGFKSATLSFARPDGKPGVTRIIELTNGSIVKVKRFSARSSPESKTAECEDVTLSYETLTVNGIPDGLIPPSHL